MSATIERIKTLKKEKTNFLLKKKNVVGVGIGKKIKSGKITDELCLKIYVEKKNARSQLKSKDLVEKSFGAINTDVVAVGKIRFYQCDQRTRKRPAFGGDSVGSCHSTAHGFIMAGTLGCVVIDNIDGSRCILSNNHVLANCDSDTNNRANVGDPLVQPGTLDGGTCATNADRIANLKRWIQFNTNGDNLIDAAIGELINDNDVNDEIGCGLGRLNGIRELTVDDLNVLQVQKCGRTTCHTTGTVSDIDVTVNVGYETEVGDVIYTFVDQIFMTDMSDPGDSGSLILDMDMSAVGLLFAGSDTVTVASPIQTVCDELNVEFPPVPDLHCRIGGPDLSFDTCYIGGPNSHILCRIGGPHILCRIGGPDLSFDTCYIGGPNSHILCRIGGPDIPGKLCYYGGPIVPLCLACGPDSSIGCGSGGPDMLIDIRGCKTGPGIDLDFNRPIDDPRKLVVLDIDKIPKGMQKAFMQMLKEMEKDK